MVNATTEFGRMTLAAAAAGVVFALAGASQAQMVAGSAGFNSGYNQAGLNLNGGYNHVPDQENGPVNVQSTDLNAPNLATGAGLLMTSTAFSVFNNFEVSGALDTFAGAGSSSSGSGSFTTVTVDSSPQGGTTTNANGKP
jgi:hypothetical protein